MPLSQLPSNNPQAKLKWVNDTELGIDWQDDHTSVYSLAYLRQSCPCAVCKEEDVHTLGLRRGIRLKPKPTVTQEITVISMMPIGRYAVQITWSDGHRAGIYSYDFLRKICPCNACVAKQSKT
jgi:DUF971 family protein